MKDDDEEEDCLDNEEVAPAVAPDSEASGSSRRSSLGNKRGFAQKSHRQTAKQKLRQLQELVAMVQVKEMCKQYLRHYNVDVFVWQNEKKKLIKPRRK